MVFRLLKENLPWIAPTAAIVFATTGYFDREDPAPAPLPTASAPAAPAPVVTATSNLAPVVQPAPIAQRPVQPVPQPEAPAVSRNVALPSNLAPAVPSQTVTASAEPALTEVVPLLGQSPVPNPERPLSNTVIFTPENARPAAAPIADLARNPAAFFGAAQANLVGNNPCVEDLKALAQETKIYFPSGGLTGEDAGMAQARLIGMIAQECPGVTIRVEGHSDPSGDPRVNLRLSQKRADAVVSRLAAAGIDISKFQSVGMGDRRPSNVRGPESSAYYDRRVEFTIAEDARTASLNLNNAAPAFGNADKWQASAPCVQRLERAVAQSKVFFASGSVTVSRADMNMALNLAQQAQDCPHARLRIVGQHSDMPGSRDSISTGRLRAVALMSSLVSAGIDPGEIIIGAPSWSESLPGQPRTNNSRVDFDVILEES